MKDELELRSDVKKRKGAPSAAALTADEVIDMLNDHGENTVYNPSAAKLIKGAGDRDIRVSSFSLAPFFLLALIWSFLFFSLLRR